MLRTLSIDGATFDLFVQTDPSVIQPFKKTQAFTLPLGEKFRIQNVIGTFGGAATVSFVIWALGLPIG
jgi:hypothetical protein